MKRLNMVMDTNILVSALRSRRGASHQLLLAIDNPRLVLNLSVPLFLEYEDAAKRLVAPGELRTKDIDAVLDYLAKVGTMREIHYLWRPLLRDPKDDMVLEVAVASGNAAIVTFNTHDFKGVDTFGIRLLKPQDVLRKIGVFT